MAPGMAEQFVEADPRVRLIVSANSFWNITNFRSRLIEALTDGGYEVLIAAPDAEAGWAKARGAEAIAITVDRSGLNPFSDAGLWMRYFRIIRSRKPAVFLGFTAKPNIYGSLAARICGVTSLPNVSGLGTAFIRDGLLARFVGALYRAAFRGCPIVFFQNPDDRDLFMSRGIINSRQGQLLSGSGIDLDHFTPVEPPLGNDERRFLFIGRLLGDKGVREFAAAAQALHVEYPRWRFQLLGEIDPGNRSGISPEEVGRWVANGLVEHLGQVDDVRPYIAAATAVVLPSYREGLPRSLLEGAAMGRPLIASDVPGNRQLVMHRVNGLLCQVRNAASLADAMRQMGEMDSERRDEMGREGRRLVERDYNVEGVVQAYLAALEQLTVVAKDSAH